MNIADSLTILKVELMQTVVPQIVDLLAAATANAQPIHEVENGLWDVLLRVGKQALGAFIAHHGSGDVGATVTLPDGQEIARLEQLHTRRYVSIFGVFELQRTVYGSREGQTLEFVPLDNRLQLPASAFSYVLQDWDQALAVEQPFGQVNQTIARMLKLQQSVDSLEGGNRQMAQDVGWFRETQGPPPPAEEGQIVVVTADCKGIVIRGQGTPTVCGGQRPAGQRAGLGARRGRAPAAGGRAGRARGATRVRRDGRARHGAQPSRRPDRSAAEGRTGGGCRPFTSAADPGHRLAARRGGSHRGGARGSSPLPHRQPRAHGRRRGQGCTASGPEHGGAIVRCRECGA